MRKNDIAATLAAEPGLAALVDAASQSGASVYLVGGAVRDGLLGREVRDLDFAVAGAWEDLPRAFARLVRGTHVVLDDQRGQHRVVTAGRTYDLAPLRGRNLEADLLLRDFTVNSMGIDPAQPGAVVDPAGGMADLAAGIIRATSRETFRDDPLRLLRAYRLAGELAFSIDSATRSHIIQSGYLIVRIAGERVRDELFRILALPRASDLIGDLDSDGLIAPLFGEGAPGAATGVRAVEDLCLRLCRRLGEPLPPLLSTETEQGVSPLSLIKLSMFDLRAVPLCARLRLGRKSTRLLILLGSRPLPLPKQQGLRPRYRFFRDYGDAAVPLLVAAAARRMLAEEALSDLLEFRQSGGGHGQDLLLTPREVMDLLALAPGPAVGAALECLRQAEAEGMVENADQARAFLLQKTIDTPLRVL